MDGILFVSLCCILLLLRSDHRHSTATTNAMSASINRSLTTIKTELEFLLESEVISETLYDHIIASLPERYVKGMPKKEYTGSVTSTTTSTPAGDATSRTTHDSPALPVTQAPSNQSTVSLAPPSGPPPSQSRSSISSVSPSEYAEAIYDYAPQQSDDLKLSRVTRLPSWKRSPTHGGKVLSTAEPVCFQLTMSSSTHHHQRTRDQLSTLLLLHTNNRNLTTSNHLCSSSITSNLCSNHITNSHKAR